MDRIMKFSLLTLLLVIYMFVSCFLHASAQEHAIPKLIIDDVGLQVTLLTPWHVYPNSTFNATLVIEATEDIEYMELKITNITTFIDENETSLPLPEQNSIRIDNFTKGQRTYLFNVTLPENSSKVVVGNIVCEWRIKQRTFFNSAKFLIAAIVDVWKEQVQKLQDKIIELEGNLTDLQSELNQTRHQLESKLGTTQRLAVIFGVTTALFAFTTVYLFKRKPQVW